ncbi:AraC family transcriptional regulator [Paenibacillus agaridevorans]|uniref:AraC family transcriptional regulator n=2 Tax=Paenibacillus agaridevorans TaxID=171404 RepID=A0A2R5EK78_9BACL|nr:AraC family transcriptional regulator [Paenibacillus agaridevorans]
MLLIEKGEGRFEVGGTTIEGKEGMLLFYQRGIWHREDSLKHPFHSIYIGFDNLRIRRLENDFFFDRDAVPVLHLGEHFPVVRSLMLKCLDAFYSNEPESRTIADHLLGILFAKLSGIAHYKGQNDKTERAGGDAVLTARRYIEERYREPITLDRLAEVAYVNKYYLAHSFKEQLGQSPIQFLIRYRLEVACYYLRATERSIGEIAEQVGYQSEPSFYHLFRRVIGVTPLQYRDGRKE